jgi:hypothetical protein
VRQELVLNLVVVFYKRSGDIMCAVPCAIMDFQVYSQFVAVFVFTIVRVVVVLRWVGIREDWKEFSNFQCSLRLVRRRDGIHGSFRFKDFFYLGLI